MCACVRQHVDPDRNGNSPPEISTTSFHIISQTAQFLERIIEYKMCVLMFSKTFCLKTRLILKRIKQNIVINVHRFSCKVLVIL